MELKNSKKRLVGCVAATGLMFGMIGNANAIAISGATAIFDWSTFEYSTSAGVDIDYVFSDVFADAYDYTNGLSEEFGTDSDFALADDISASASVLGASSHASVSDDGILSNAVAMGTGVVGEADAFSFIDQEVYFFVNSGNSGAVDITFAIDYSLSAFAAADNAGEFAESGSFLSAGLENTYSGEFVDDYAELSAFGDDQVLEGFKDFGTFTFTASFYDQDEGLLTFAAESYAFHNSLESINDDPATQVPAPASFLLMLAGIAGMGFRKKLRS